MVRSSTTTTTSDCLPPTPPSNDDWLIYEILTRLPVKSLFRFKTVSKEWCSLIEKDQNFTDLHLTRSKTRPPCRIFIVVPVPLTSEERKKIMDSEVEIDHWPYKEFYITADLVFEDNGTMEAVVDTVREVNSHSYDMITEPVNGLFCPIESQFEHVVRICNISTQQVSSSFQSTSEEPKRNQYGISYELKYKWESLKYGFGFDPVTKEHKLVCLWHVHPHNGDRDYYFCEVLTLGRQGGISSWRRINDVPPPYELVDDSDVSDDSVYVNGVIHWSTYDLNHGFWGSKFDHTYIVAFDVGKEKFRTITVPYLILGKEAYYFRGNSRHGRRVNLLKVNGHLAMLIRVNSILFKLYIYENADYKKEEEDLNNKERWIEVKSITLPLDLEENCVKFYTFAGSDDKIIATFYNRRGCGKTFRKNKCLSFYCFNWKKDSWTEFEVSGIPSSVPHICFDSYVTTFSESLLPVNNQAALS